MEKFLPFANILGGVAFFLYGVRHASEGLWTLFGGRLKGLIRLFTQRRLTGVAAGVGAAIVLQSAGAATAMLAGFVDAGILSLGQALSVILGADIGATLTVQLLVFPLYAPALAGGAVGVGLQLYAKSERLRGLGRVLTGLALVFFGLFLMRQGAGPLKENAAVVAFLARLGESRIYGALAGLIFAGLIQSGTATVGLLFVMAKLGLISIEAALPIIVGANVGSCVFTFVSCLGRSRRALQVATAHFLFKLGGAVVLLPLLGFVLPVLHSWSGDEPAREVANAYTLINLAIAALFLPTAPLVAEFIRRIVPLEKNVPSSVEDAARHRSVDALRHCEENLLRAGDITAAMLVNAEEALTGGRRKCLETIRERDERLDILYDSTVTILARARAAHGAPERFQRVFYLIKNMEHIGDLVSKTLADLARKNREADRNFAIEEEAELRKFIGDVRVHFALVQGALRPGGGKDLDGILAYEDRIRERHRDFYQAHLDRMRRDVVEAIETDAVYMDALLAIRNIHQHVAEMARILKGDGKG